MDGKEATNRPYGKIIIYHDKPEIVVTTPEQVVIQ
jgi:hypothetical protein